MSSALLLYRAAREQLFKVSRDSPLFAPELTTAPAPLQVNNMPMMALVNPVYDCLFRLAQPESLQKEEEVSAGKRSCECPPRLAKHQERHGPGGAEEGKLPPWYVLEGDSPGFAAQKEVGWRCWL